MLCRCTTNVIFHARVMYLKLTILHPIKSKLPAPRTALNILSCDIVWALSSLPLHVVCQLSSLLPHDPQFHHPKCNKLVPIEGHPPWQLQKKRKLKIVAEGKKKPVNRPPRIDLSPDQSIYLCVGKSTETCKKNWQLYQSRITKVKKRFQHVSWWIEELLHACLWWLYFF